MILNYYENTLIKNEKLPVKWQSQAALEELFDFLQSNWEERSIFYEDGNVNSKQSFLDFVGFKGISTKNYVGTIVFKGQQLNIFPKVFKTDKEDTDIENLNLKHLMYNLIKWIEYATKIDYPYINISAEMDNTNNLQELFISLYIRYVRAALDRGLFYRYEEKRDIRTSIKGRFDVKDYFVRRYPNGTMNKFECTYTTFEFDNLLNRIIKCTLKHIMKLTNAKNKKIIRNLLIKLGDVTDQRCTPSDCDKIKLSKMQSKYKIILSMSKMFLLNKSTNYNMDSQDTFCFLFPTHILYEGFIGGFLSATLQDEAKVTLQASEVSLIDNIRLGDRQFEQAFIMRHDILVEHKEKGMFILDTKYKETTRFDGNDNFRNNLIADINSGDLYQMLTYAVSRGIKRVYLLYPQFRFEDVEPNPAIMNKSVQIAGTREVIEIYAVRIPFVFEQNEDDTKINLKSIITSLFD